MKIARLPSKRNNLILTIALIIGLPILVYASYQVVQLVSNASADTQPRNVLLSNLSTSSAVISWTTDSSVRGTVAIIASGTEGSPVIDKRGNDKRYTHYVELTGLDPNTSYSFVITSGTTKYSATDNTEFKFKTAPITSDAPTPNPIYGTVENVSGDDVILFAEPQDKSTYPVSTTMPSGGNWIMDLSALRKIEDKSLLITDTDTNLVITAISGSQKGGVVSGVYSELFDSNGKLNATKNLSLSTNSTIYTYFPSSAKFEAVETVVDNTQNDTTDNSTDTTDNTNTDMEQTIDGKVFRIVKDINWTDMTSTISTTWSYGASTIQVTNLTDTGFTVSWVSQVSEQGYINYGTSSSDLSSQAIDERDSVTNKGSYYVHSVSLARLQPETKYYFEVVSGSETYDNSGSNYTATTFATLSSAPAYVSITGSIDNMPTSSEAIVVAYLKDSDGTGSSGSSGLISTVADDNGKWILSIADSRTSDGNEYFEYTDSDKIYFKVISTAASQDTTSISLDGITDNDIELSIVDGDTSSTVDKLSSYGVI